MKRGFTLIELLAVIVILAIIALIAVPIVLSIIDDTKESSILRSGEFFVDGLEKSIMKESMSTGNSLDFNEQKGRLVNVLEGKDLKRASELIDEFVAGIVSGKKTTTREIKISTAIGMALYQKGKDLSCENVFVRADANMYQNKIAMKAKGF